MPDEGLVRNHMHHKLIVPDEGLVRNQDYSDDYTIPDEEVEQQGDNARQDEEVEQLGDYARQDEDIMSHIFHQHQDTGKIVYHWLFHWP